MSNIQIKQYNGTEYKLLCPVFGHESYNNLSAKGYISLKFIENIKFDSVSLNKNFVCVFFENFSDFVFNEKPNLTDIFITVNKISGTILEQNTNNSSRGYTVETINHETNSIYSNIMREFFSIPFNKEVNTYFEYNNLSFGLFNFITSKNSVEQIKKQFLTPSIFSNQLGREVSSTKFQQDLAFYAGAVNRSGKSSLLFEGIKIYYR